VGIQHPANYCACVCAHSLCVGAYVRGYAFSLAARPLQELLNSKVIQDFPASSANNFARLQPVGPKSSRQISLQAAYLGKYPTPDCSHFF